jgi:hypothetical protein
MVASLWRPPVMVVRVVSSIVTSVSVVICVLLDWMVVM